MSRAGWLSAIWLASEPQSEFFCRRPQNRSSLSGLLAYPQIEITIERGRPTILGPWIDPRPLALDHSPGRIPQSSIPATIDSASWRRKVAL